MTPDEIRPKCQAIVSICRETGDQKQCDKPATHRAYTDSYFCDECLHDCMQDAWGPEEQASVEVLA